MASRQQIARLNAVVPFARTSMARWGVPASVTLAQWTFEASWGEDPLVALANNCFGIKAIGGQQYVEHCSTEDLPSGDVKRVAQFAKYDSVGESFDAHGRLLATSHHYIAAMRALPSVRGFCDGLQAGGYSTSRDPKTRLLNYAAKLYGQVLHYDLVQYDTPAAPPPTPAKEAA